MSSIRGKSLCSTLGVSNNQVSSSAYIKLRLNVANDITINADKHCMIQLLDNLIINTISYCKKGKISIILLEDNSEIHLILTDEGIGIPQGELYDVFNPFTVSSKTRTPAGGRGVVLAICQRILEVHNGTIKAGSDGVKGAIFRGVLNKG